MLLPSRIPRRLARSRTRMRALSMAVGRSTSVSSSSMRPASIFERSRMSLMRDRRCRPDSRMSWRYSVCFSLTSPNICSAASAAPWARSPLPDSDAGRVRSPCHSGELLHDEAPASGIKMLRDFVECVNASEEGQIVRRDPAQHEAIRLQPVCALRHCHLLVRHLAQPLEETPAVALEVERLVDAIVLQVIVQADLRSRHPRRARAGGARRCHRRAP